MSAPPPYPTQNGQPVAYYPPAGQYYGPPPQGYPQGQYMQQPGYPPQQQFYGGAPGYGHGPSPVQPVVVVKERQRVDDGPSAGECCLLALCAACCACCLCDALT